MCDYKIGDTIEGKVTGIKPYGIFLSIGNRYTGMIHISEITNNFVEKVELYADFNEKLKVKILDIDYENKHMNLSLRALNKGRRINNIASLRTGKPVLKIGYSPLEAKLDQWIKEKKK